MTAKDVIEKFFGSNVFPADVVTKFDIKHTSISDEIKAKEYIKQLKQDGYAVKSKQYSDFKAIFAAKAK
jgi:hypothetical protein